MTHPKDPADELIGELLRSLEQDHGQSPSQRDEVLADVLAQYDKSRHSSSTEVLLIQPKDQPVQRPVAHLWLAVAAALIVAVVGWATLSERRVDTTLEATDEDGDEDLVPTNSMDVSATRVSVLDGQITFELVNDLMVVELQGGQLLLSSTGSASNTADAIVIVETGSTRFGDRLAQWQADGLVNGRAATVELDGRLFDRWIVGITQTGSAEFGCTINEECVEIVEGVEASSFSSGTSLTVIEVIDGDGQSVLLIADENGQYRTDLAELIVTIVVS